MRIGRLALAVVLVGGAGAYGERELTAAGPAQARPAAIPFTISRETTHYTGPLRADGTVDYVEGINEHLSRGVTPADNAAVALLAAIAPVSNDEQAHYGRLCAKLEIAAVAGGGADVGPDPEGLDLANREPWTAEKAPAVARWLKGLNARLERVVEASRRERYYMPLVREGAAETILDVQLPHLNMTAFLTNALRTRAMLGLGSGDTAGFRRDAVALVRLGRLASHAATFVEQLVARRAEDAGLEAIRVAATGGGLPANVAEQLLTDLKAAPPAFEEWGLAERTFALECLQVAALRGTAEASAMLRKIRPARGDAGAAAAAAPARVRPGKRDWNAALREANEWYPRLAAARALPTYAERARETEAIRRELAGIEANAQGGATSSQVEDPMIAFAMTRVARALEDGTRLAAQRTLTETAVALSSFRAKAGEYPASLEELVPAYFTREPIDPFADRPLEYRAAGGYVLSSVGPGAAGTVAGERADGLIVRVEK